MFVLIIFVQPSYLFMFVLHSIDDDVDYDELTLKNYCEMQTQVVDYSEKLVGTAVESKYIKKYQQNETHSRDNSTLTETRNVIIHNFYIPFVITPSLFIALFPHLTSSSVFYVFLSRVEILLILIVNHWRVFFWLKLKLIKIHFFKYISESCVFLIELMNWPIVLIVNI